MQSAKRLEYKNPTHDYTHSSVSSNMVDDNDEIVKHKPKANDNGMEKNPLSKLHVHLVVCWAFIEAGSVMKQNGVWEDWRATTKAGTFVPWVSQLQSASAEGLKVSSNYPPFTGTNSLKHFLTAFKTFFLHLNIVHISLPHWKY